MVLFLVALMVTALGAEGALVLSAAAVLSGVAIFVSALPAEEEVAHEDVRGLFGVLRLPWITTLVLTMFPVGSRLAASR